MSSKKLNKQALDKLNDVESVANTCDAKETKSTYKKVFHVISSRGKQKN